MWGSKDNKKLNVNIGKTSDTSATTDTGTWSLLALFKRLVGKFPQTIGQKTKALSLSVALASDQTFASEYLEDTAAATGDRGTFMLAVRRDTMSGSPVTTDGDYTQLSVNSTGYLHILDKNSDALLLVIGAKDDAAATTDTGTFSLIALIKRQLQYQPEFGQATMANSMPVVIASDQTLEVQGNIAVVAASFTRPADGAAYLAGDVVANSVGAPTILTFANIARVIGKGGFLSKARIWTDDKTNVARYRLHLYNTSITMLGDNVPNTLLWANRVGYIGYIDFDAMSTENGTAATDVATTQNLALKMEYISGASRDIYGVLTTLDAFTPVTGKQYYIELTAENIN